MASGVFRISKRGDQISPVLHPSPSQLGGLGSAVSSPVVSGAEPQPPTILVHFRLKRKHLVLYKSRFSDNCSIIQKWTISYNCQYIISFQYIRSGAQPGSPSNSVNSQISYPQPIPARDLGSAVSSPAGSGAEPQPPKILGHFRSKRKLLVRFKLTWLTPLWYHSGVVKKLRLEANWSFPSSLSSPAVCIRNVVSSASGVWGEAPAASNFGAFQIKKDAFGAIQIYHSGVVKKLRIGGKFIFPLISILSN